LCPSPLPETSRRTSEEKGECIRPEIQLPESNKQRGSCKGKEREDEKWVACPGRAEKRTKPGLDGQRYKIVSKTRRRGRPEQRIDAGNGKKKGHLSPATVDQG